MMDAVARYFDSVGASYERRTKRFPWRTLRAIEATHVLRALPAAAPRKILEVGCGAGFYTRLLRARYPLAEIHCVDQSAAMLSHVDMPNVAKSATDFLRFSSEDKFDLIVALGVAEFVGEKFFVKLAELLDSGGGRALLLVPDDSTIARLYRRFHARHGIAIDLFSAEDLARIGLAAGLHLESRKIPLFSRIVLVAVQ